MSELSCYCFVFIYFFAVSVFNGQLLVFTMGRNSCQAATNENNN